MSVKLQTDHHLEFLSLTGSCIGSSESTLVKMAHCLLEIHVAAQLCKGTHKNRLNHIELLVLIILLCIYITEVL